MTIRKSEVCTHLYGALARAQSQISVPTKSALNPAFKSRYVDLSSVLAAVLPAWNAAGLALSQWPSVSDDGSVVELTTLITHASGEWLESSIKMPVGGKKDAHAIGSAVTYARRYALAAISGLMQDDDDGNLASSVEAARGAQRAETKPQPETKPETKPQPEAYVSFEEEIRAVSSGALDLQTIGRWALAKGRGDVSTWPASKRKQLIDWLREGSGVQSVQGWLVAEREKALVQEEQVQASEAGQAAPAPAAAPEKKSRAKKGEA